MQDHNDHERLLHTRKQTARQLSLSIRTVDALISSHELKVIRVGRRVLVHKDEIARFACRNHDTRTT